jgi:hypothetical protein
MDRINRFIAQVYGYSVCLITVIVMLISIKGTIDAAFDLSNPLRAEGGYGRFGPLTSFELYKMQARGQIRSERFAPGPTTARPASDSPSDSLSDAQLQKLYEAERESQIGSARFRATRNLVSGILFMILAGIIFAIHWRWLKGVMSAPNTA